MCVEGLCNRRMIALGFAWLREIQTRSRFLISSSSALNLKKNEKRELVFLSFYGGRGRVLFFWWFVSSAIFRRLVFGEFWDATREGGRKGEGRVTKS